MRWILFIRREPRLNSGSFAPESRPKRIHFPSIERSYNVESALLAPTQSRTALKLPPFLAMRSLAHDALSL